MIDCRADRSGLRLALGFVLGLAAVAPASAQLLMPPLRTTTDTPAPPAPASPSAPAGFEVESIRPVDLEAVGLIDAANGGLAANAWNGTARAIAERLVGELPAPVASTPAREMAIRLLVSTTTTPSGDGKTNLVALRARKLQALGAFDAAEKLALRIPQREIDADVLTARLDAAWLAGDDKAACALTRDILDKARAPDVQRGLLFCQALEGDRQRAELGLTLLRDRGVPEDATFINLLFAQGGDGRGVKIDNAQNLSPLGFAMLRAAKVAAPPELARGDDPALLRALAAYDGAAPEIRLAAAERAETYGAIPSADLAKAYAAITLTPAQTADAAAFARTDGGARGRAALYQAAKAATGPARLAALGNLWRYGRERGGYATLVRASIDLLAEVPPTPDLAPFAGEAVRAFLLAGFPDDAREWLRFARVARIGSDAGAAQDRYAALWAIAVIAGQPWDETDDAKAFLDWRAAQAKLDAQAAPTRVALATTLLAGLGQLPPGAAFAAFPEKAPERAQTRLPHPALWTALHQAAVAGRTAETIALGAQALGPEGPAGAAPQTLLALLDALRAVGQEQAARALAVEAAIASGL
jgi:hypothetical protein